MIQTKQGGRHADATKIYGFCVVRNLRSERLYCHGSVGAGCAGRNHARRHAKDFVADRRSDAGLYDDTRGSDHRGGSARRATTHPGVESAYVLEGGFELPIQGQATRTLKPGDGFQIPPDTPHAGGKPGDAKTRVLSTYVVEKGKPLASPA
jgi:uncharacterized cupin superfamily protein